MAIIKKTLFPDNLDKIPTSYTDVEPLSKYFKITELPETFTGGKNAFLIQGSEYLVADSLIKIELKDANGDVIYHEPGEGIISASVNGEPIITEYYEGVSKLVSVYIYPDTAYGPCTLTILGELASYDNNGINTPVSAGDEGYYNVKWQKQINVNPSLANTTKIRFYKRPTAKISEILSPIYKIENDLKVASAVTQSFANIKLSNLETFAGDVKRVKVFRTSVGDISDYDMIQDILVESKELLTSYGLSGSVVGNTGIFTSEVLKNQWNSGSLNATLNSTKVEAGVRLTGSGLFTYTQSLDIQSANTYELNLDAFYSASTDSNLGIYLNQITTSLQNGIQVPIIISSSIATLVGTQPTKNLLDTTIPFKIDRNYPTASLYFSQSQGQWHLGNVSLRLSQDTAFSPDEIGFITTMPTVLGNETFNFKFEFYDINNNYVPVEVTQSALFNGGNTNIGGTILLISSSASSSLADLNRISSSISGTMTVYSSSANTTIVTLSGSVSGSIVTLSGSVSSSITTLSGSVSQSVALTLSSSLSKVQQLADGTFGYTGTFIDGTTVFAPVIGGTNGYISKLFTVGDTTAARINLDARNIADGAPDNLRRIWIGSGTYGTYNSTNTNVYLDSAGKFSLGNKLSWSGTALSLTGEVVITSGTTKTAIDNAASAASTAQTTANTANATAIAVDGKVFTDANGKIIKAPSTGIAGLYLGSEYLGFHNGNGLVTGWKTYMANNGNFFLSGTGANGLSWDGTTLNITGAISVTGGNAETTTGAQSKADSARDSAVSTASGDATTKSNNAYNNAVAAAAGDATTKSDAARNAAISAASSDATTKSNAAFNSAAAQVKSLADGGYAGAFISSTTIYAPVIGGTVGYFSEQFRVGNAGIVLDGTNKRIYIGSGTYGNSNTGFYADSAGNFSLGDKLSFNGSTLAINGNITATGGTFSGPVKAGNVTIKSDGIKVSGDTGGIELDGGRGIFSDNGGRIYLGGNGSYFCTDGTSTAAVSPGRLSANNSGAGGSVLQLSNYGDGYSIFSGGQGPYYFEGSYIEFRTSNGSFQVKGLELDPANPGTNYNVKIVNSSGLFFKSSSTRKRKNIYGNWKEDGVLDSIKNVPVERFKYKSWEDDEVETFGLIAEDLHNNGFWQAVTYEDDDNGKAIYEEEKVAGIDYEKVSSILWKGMQELTKRIEELEAKLSGSI